MRYLTAILLILAIIAATRAASMAPVLSDFAADVGVTVTHDDEPLEGAVVRLDLNNNGIWEEHLGEPQAITGVDGVADFGTIVSIQNPGGDDPADVIDWHPSRILTGNLRGAVGARDVRFDFVLPAGAGRASLGLYDLRGRRLAGTDGVGDLALDVPGSLPSGVYFVRLSADRAAAVTHRITSVGQRAQTVRARQVSAVEAIAAGWVESRAQADKRMSCDGGHAITIMVSHVLYGGMNQAETVIDGLNEFIVVMPTAKEGFVHIPPGKFVMGSPEDEPGRHEWEGPQHEVTLTRGFYMSQYEVTDQWWAEVMNETPTTSLLPKRNVSWDMAVAFCNALSLRDGLTPAYTVHGPNGDVAWHPIENGYRLPTEAEWEYARRAGSATAFASGPITNSGGFCIPLDPNLDTMGWYCGNASSRRPVGLKQANAWGLYDMHGNLFEWVWCGFRWYTPEPQVDPVQNVGPGAHRRIRGGGWGALAVGCRSAFRVVAVPDHSDVHTGFRPVRTFFESP